MSLSVIFVLLSALLAAINVPFSKFLLPHVPTLLLSSLTFLGASVGTGIITLVRVLRQKKNFKALKGRDWFYIAGVNIADTAANIMLFYGIEMLNGDTASLLESFETVSTALIAFCFFKEKPSWRLIIGILVIVGGSAILSFDPSEGYQFNPASLLIIGATICWGFDNNFSKKVSSKDPFEFSFFKCFIPGNVILLIALLTGNYHAEGTYVGLSLLDGFVAYGLSVTCLLVGFRKLSASLGTAVYAANPFFGAIISIIFFPYMPSWTFYVGMALLVAGEIVVFIDSYLLEKNEKSKSGPDQALVPKN